MQQNNLVPESCNVISSCRELHLGQMGLARLQQCITCCLNAKQQVDPGHGVSVLCGRRQSAAVSSAAERLHP